MFNRDLAGAGIVVEGDHRVPGTRAGDCRVTPATTVSSALTPVPFSTFFGSEDDQVGASILLDGRHGPLVALLDRLRAGLGARSASLLVPATTCGWLRPLALCGDPPSSIEALCLHRGDGVAGTAWAEASFQCRRGAVPVFAEQGGSSTHRIAASLPVTGWGRTIAVLSANIDTDSDPTDPVIRSALEQVARDAAPLMLSAIDFSPLDGEARARLIPRIVDLLLSADESLAVRIARVATVLQRALGATRGAFHVVDRLCNRVQAIDPPDGRGIFEPGGLPADHALLRQLLRAREPRLLEFSPPDPERPVGLLCQPVHVVHPFGLIVLEGVSLAGEERERSVRLLRETVEQVEEIIQIEDQVAAQDLTQEMEMRIADETGRASGLPAPAALQAVLSLAQDLLAGEIALWIPAGSRRPVSTTPGSALAARILSAAWDRLDMLLQQAAGDPCGSARLNVLLDGNGGETIHVPGLGVRDPRDRGTLIVLFPPEEVAGALSQVPEDVLCRVLLRLAESIPGEG